MHSASTPTGRREHSEEPSDRRSSDEDVGFLTARTDVDEALLDEPPPRAVDKATMTSQNPEAGGPPQEHIQKKFCSYCGRSFQKSGTQSESLRSPCKQCGVTEDESGQEYEPRKLFTTAPQSTTQSTVYYSIQERDAVASADASQMAQAQLSVPLQETQGVRYASFPVSAYYTATQGNASQGPPPPPPHNVPAPLREQRTFQPYQQSTPTVIPCAPVQPGGGGMQMSQVSSVAGPAGQFMIPEQCLRCCFQREKQTLGNQPQVQELQQVQQGQQIPHVVGNTVQGTQQWPQSTIGQTAAHVCPQMTYDAGPYKWPPGYPAEVCQRCCAVKGPDVPVVSAGPVAPHVLHSTPMGYKMLDSLESVSLGGGKEYLILDQASGKAERWHLLPSGTYSLLPEQRAEGTNLRSGTQPTYGQAVSATGSVQRQAPSLYQPLQDSPFLQLPGSQLPPGVTKRTAASPAVFVRMADLSELTQLTRDQTFSNLPETTGPSEQSHHSAEWVDAKPVPRVYLTPEHSQSTSYQTASNYVDSGSLDTNTVNSLQNPIPRVLRDLQSRSVPVQIPDFRNSLYSAAVQHILRRTPTAHAVRTRSGPASVFPRARAQAQAQAPEPNETTAEEEALSASLLPVPVIVLQSPPREKAPQAQQQRSAEDSGSLSVSAESGQSGGTQPSAPSNQTYGQSPVAPPRRLMQGSLRSILATAGSVTSQGTRINEEFESAESSNVTSDSTEQK